MLNEIYLCVSLHFLFQVSGPLHLLLGLDFRLVVKFLSPVLIITKLSSMEDMLMMVHIVT